MQEADADNPRESNAIPTLNESVVVRWLIGLCLVLFAANKFLTMQVTAADGAGIEATGMIQAAAGLRCAVS